MKRFIITVLALVTLVAWAEDKGATPAPKRIGALEAGKYTNETCIVTGKVVQVTIHEKLTYLNMEKPYPDSPFVGIVFAKSTNQFGDLKELEGKSVELQGKIVSYRDKPQIVLESSNQLQILTEKK